MTPRLKIASERKPKVWVSPPLYYDAAHYEWTAKERCGCSPGCSISMLSACHNRIADEFVGISKCRPIVIVISQVPVNGAVRAIYTNMAAASALGTDKDSTCWWWVEQ